MDNSLLDNKDLKILAELDLNARATNSQIVDPPPFPLTLEIPYPQGRPGSNPGSGTKSPKVP